MSDEGNCVGDTGGTTMQRWNQGAGLIIQRVQGVVKNNKRRFIIARLEARKRRPREEDDGLKYCQLLGFVGQ